MSMQSETNREIEREINLVHVMKKYSIFTFYEDRNPPRIEHFKILSENEKKEICAFLCFRKADFVQVTDSLELEQQ